MIFLAGFKMSAPIKLSWSFHRAISGRFRQTCEKNLRRDLYSIQFIDQSNRPTMRLVDLLSKYDRKIIFSPTLVKSNIQSQRRNYSLHDRKCWNCGKPVVKEEEKFFCECGVVQSVRDLSYFEIIGIDEQFDVNIADLSKKYKEIQKQIHPDKHTLKSEEEKVIAEVQSSLVNKAYSTLVKPLNRALYMLERAGQPLEEDNNAVDQEFLMEIMEINEEIADAESLESLKPIEQDNKEKLDKNIQNLSEAFQKGDIISAKHLVIQLKYFTNIDDKIKELYRGQF